MSAAFDPLLYYDECDDCTATYTLQNLGRWVLCVVLACIGVNALGMFLSVASSWVCGSYSNVSVALYIAPDGTIVKALTGRSCAWKRFSPRKPPVWDSRLRRCHQCIVVAGGINGRSRWRRSNSSHLGAIDNKVGRAIVNSQCECESEQTSR